MNKEAGFTLLEVMIVFAIFLTLSSLAPQAFQLISFDPKYNQRIEASIFFQQLSSDIYQSSALSLVNNTLYLHKANHQTVSYAYVQQRIRRQVNNIGQEIVLQNVQEIQFSLYKNGIDVRIMDKYLQVHEKRISHLLRLEDMNDEQ